MNKYERAADELNVLLSKAYPETLALLRTAAKLPKGVDPVQVLERAAKHHEYTKNLTGSALDSPCTDPLWADPPAPAPDANEREHCERIAEHNALRCGRPGYLRGLLEVERHDAYAVGFEAGRKAGGK